MSDLLPRRPIDQQMEAMRDLQARMASLMSCPPVTPMWFDEAAKIPNDMVDAMLYGLAERKPNVPKTK